MGKATGEALCARRVGSHEQAEALEFLSTAPDENLVLIDLVSKLGNSLGTAEVPPQIFAAFDGERLEGLAALRPSIALSSGMTRAAIESLLPYLLRTPSGLVKSDRQLVEPIWQALEAAGRRSVIDRIEIAYRLRPEAMIPADPSLPGVARSARQEDLEELVYAARASLWEEDRPDPAEGDPLGFQRWVEGRLSRARIVSEGGRTIFAAYADVRRPEGWLVQGVYTWPDFRRRGYARRGMDSIVREAFACGASHVQLAVVEGNERASKLYENLGFERFAELRTILFN
jgi:ribosomal protein S18 acetylase RimI-like enzyme